MDGLVEMQAEPKQEEARREDVRHEDARRQRLEPVAGDFGYFGGLCLVFGAVGTFFLYRNPSGITFPAYVLMVYGLAWLVFRRLGMEIKRLSWFVAAVSVLIAASTCATASPVIHDLNRTALFLLFIVFVLHQFYDDVAWNIGKYMISIIIFLVQAVGFISCPVKHGIRYVKTVRSGKYRTFLWVLAGFIVGIPVAIFLSALLASADVVFDALLSRVLVEFLNPFTVVSVVMRTIFGMFAMYCVICSACARGIKGEVKDRRNAEPVIAISFMALICAVYLVFCAIQVVYLFMGRGSLPEGMTYAGYARQGFFQLLFVAMLNLVMVLLCLKYFRRSKLLNGMLLVISLCTYVMIASAFYRMILYVGQYRLTFLRLFVLWFLILLAVIMAGVVLVTFKNRFPLFRYCLVVTAVFYLVFAWMKPDYQIARYNLAAYMGQTAEEMGQSLIGEDFYLWRLSADAAPAVGELPGDSEEKRELLGRYLAKYERSGGHAGLRTYNFSYARALEIWEELGGQ